MKHLLTTASAALLLACPALAQITLPAENAGNFEECFNSDGDGVSCGRYQHRSGSWVTGDSDGVDDVVLTDEGSVIIPTGSFYKHVLDYRALFNQGDPVCGPEPIVETPHHTPFVLEFSRYFRTRASYIDYGLSKGWKENFFFLLNITNSAEYRVARFEVPSGAEMNWIDVGSTGSWSEDNDGAQSMVLTLVDEPGDQHLVTDRWGGKYHFVPNTTSRAFLQYLVDWLEDENGNRITLTYNANGYPIAASDGFGRVMHYVWTPVQFGGTRHLARVVLPGGQWLQLQHFFDSPQAYTLTYPNGDVASYGFGTDADGDFYYFNDPLGQPGARKQRVYTYGTGPSLLDTGRVRGIKDESGHVQLARYEEASGPAIHVEYDDGRGYQYDCAMAGLNGRVTNLRTGAVTTNEWQGNGCLLKKKIDPLGSWLTADYDDVRALRVLRHNLDASADTWTYGANNRVEDHVDANGNETHYDYDSHGNLVRKTYADTTFEEWTRHASGRVTDYRNRNGKVTSYQYDAHGNVSAIVLPAEPSEANPVIAYQYDVDGHVLSMTDPVGRVTTYQYDSLGRRVATNHPDASSQQVVYGTMDPMSSTDPVSTAGLVVSRTDRNGNVTNYEYGDNDRLVRESGALGEIVYTYDAADRLVARSENGDGESYAYDAAYRRTTLTQVVDATHAHVTTYQYDLLDRVIESVDPHGFTTQTSYYPEGEVALQVRQIGGSGVAATSFTYDFNGNLLTEDNGSMRSYVYDSNDRRVRAYDPAPFDGNYVEYTYDAEGNLLSRRDQEGNTTAFVYSNRGRLIQETDPTGVIVLHEYDLDDSLARTTRPATLGERAFSYDAGGRLAGGTVVVDGGANDITTSKSHDGQGNVLTRVDGEGGVYVYEYDGRDRVIRSVDPLAEETLTAYSDDGAPFDARLAAGQGSAVTVTDPNGQSTTTVYDGVGRVMREIDELGASTVFTRDVPSAGRVGVLRTDRMGQTTAEYRDGLGRVVHTTDELNHGTTFVYNAQDDLTRIIDARGKETAYTCDALGRRTAEDLPELGDTIAYSYRANGLLDERIDQQGNHTQYGYDAAGRRVSVLYQDASTDTFVHDAGGRLIEATSGLYGNTVTFTYDRADRLIRDGSSGLVDLTYDRRSLEASILTPSGREFVNTYTARGELDTIALDATVLVDNAYDADGRLVQREFANGTSSSWERDAHGWVKSIQHTRGVVDLLQLAYKRDGEGRMLRQRNLTNTSRSETYFYDAAGRLVSYRGKVPPVRESSGPIDPSKGVSKVLEWVLDQVGNWSQFTHNGTHEFRLHSDSNELIGISGLGNLVYDLRGNLIEDGANSYKYDFNNRLKSVNRLTDDELLATYAYDALGRRLGRTFLDEASLAIRRLIYCYAGERIVEIREKPTASDPDQFLAAFAHGTQPDEPLVMVQQSQTYSFHHNEGGSTVVLTDVGGDPTERYEYDPYGGTRVFTGIWAPIGNDTAVSNPFAFQGRENDAEIGLIFFRERHLNPFLGRYMQRNPAGYAGGINLYSAASLVNGRSPHGLDD